MPSNATPAATSSDGDAPLRASPLPDTLPRSSPTAAAAALSDGDGDAAEVDVAGGGDAPVATTEPCADRPDEEDAAST